MTTPTSCTLTYTLNVIGALSQATLATQMSAIQLPLQEMTNIGLSLTSDTVTTPSSTVVRTIVLSLLPIFQGFAPVSSANAFPGSAVSSSPNDAAPAGSGARVLSMRFHAGPKNVPASQTIVLNGTTPVSMTAPFVLTTDSLTVLEAGPGGSNDGLIQLFSGSNASGTVMANILGNFQGSIVSTSDADTAGGVGAQTVEITYTDKTGAGPFTESVTLNGTTPVNLTNLDHATITNMQLTSIGTAGGNLGQITLYSGLDATGGPTGLLQPSFFAYFPCDPSLTTPEQTVALGAPVKQFFSMIFSNQMVSPIIASNPTFS